MLLWRPKNDECRGPLSFSEAVSCAWSVELSPLRPNFQRGFWFHFDLSSFCLFLFCAKGQTPRKSLDKNFGFFLLLVVKGAGSLPSSCSCTSSALAIGASSIASLSKASDLPPPPSLCSGASQYFCVKYTFLIRVVTMQAACFFPCMWCWAVMGIKHSDQQPVQMGKKYPFPPIDRSTIWFSISFQKSLLMDSTNRQHSVIPTAAYTWINKYKAIAELILKRKAPLMENRWWMDFLVWREDKS